MKINHKEAKNSSHGKQKNSKVWKLKFVLKKKQIFDIPLGWDFGKSLYKACRKKKLSISEL